MTVRRLLIVVAILVATPRLARADAEADRLFKQGKALLAEGNIADACDAFAASDARTSRVGTLLNLGDCREQNGQIATAWATFLRAAALAQRDSAEHDRADEARRRAGYLQPRLSYLTISVSDASDLDGLVITRDGAPVERALWNQGVPVDGGSYEIAASAPGQDPWRTSVAVAAENARAVVEVPRFKELGELAATPAPAPAVVVPPAPPAPRRRILTPLRFGALGASGLSVGAIILGAVAGSASSSEAAAASAICSSPCTDPRGQALIAESKTDAMIANVAFAGAAVAAVGAITLWIVGRPPALTIVPEVGRDHARVTLSLEF